MGAPGFNGSSGSGSKGRSARAQSYGGQQRVGAERLVQQQESAGARLPDAHGRGVACQEDSRQPGIEMPLQPPDRLGLGFRALEPEIGNEQVWRPGYGRLLVL